MKKALFLIASVVVCALPFAAHGQMKHVPGELIVQFSHDANPSTALVAHRTFQGTPTGIALGDVLSAHMNVYLVHYNPDFSNARGLLESIRRDKAFSIAQFNHYVHNRDTVIPNDPQFEQQWHHLNTGQTGGTPGADIGSTSAWETTTGGLTALGDTIVVCVIEGGNLLHVDLQDNAWVNHGEIPGNGIDDDANGFVDDYLGWNVNTQSDNPVFNGGHGTSVMGMIGAKGDNGVGLTGINWNVKIMSVAGQNLFNEASVVAAYNYPLVMRKLYNQTDGERGAFVVATNASWGIDGGNIDDVPIWKAFYDTLGVYGILNCGATSNSNVNIDVVSDIPTAAPSPYMVSVTATNHNDVRTFSAYGATTIDLAAPGANVRTTSGQSNYTTTSGTSFASPLTAGVIALLYSVPCEAFATLVKQNPQLGADYVRYALMEGVDIIDGLIGFTVTGGRVNVNNSLNILLENCNEELCLPPFAFNFSLTDDTLYSFTWNSIDENGVAIRYRIQDEEEWTVIENVTETPFEFVPEELCANYEFEIAASCGAVDGEYAFGSTRFFESKGCCVAPEIVAVNEVDASTIAITWEVDFAIEAYEVYYRLLGGADWIFAGIFDESQATIGGLEGCTQYELLVKPLCAEGFDTAFILVQRTKDCGPCLDNDFCASRGQSAFWEHIASVEIGDYVNVSGNNGGYIHFEDTDLVLEQMGEYVATFTPGFLNNGFNQFFRVWIDFNQDGVFTADERVMSSTQGSTQAITDTIAIPADAMLGVTRMRVAMKFVGNSTQQVQSCEIFAEGETEDYCLTITTSTLSTSQHAGPARFVVHPNPTQGDLRYQSLGLEGFHGGDATLQVVDLTGKLVHQSLLVSTSGMLHMHHLDNGMYLYNIVSTLTREPLHSGKFIIAR